MIVAGVAARKVRILDSHSTTALAHLVTKCLYPALIYASITANFTLQELFGHWSLPAGAFMIMALGVVSGGIVSIMMRFDSRPQKLGFRFQTTINNYSFLPIPLALFLLGDNAVAMLLFSTVGSELAVWTLGISALTGGKLSWRSIRALVNMPMAAIAAAAVTLCITGAVQAFGAEHMLSSGAVAHTADALLDALDLFGKGTIPVAMVVAGSRMAELRVHHLTGTPLMTVAAMRLLIIPAIAIGFLTLLPFASSVRPVLTLVLVTHIGSILTVPLWLLLLSVG